MATQEELEIKRKNDPESKEAYDSDHSLSRRKFIGLIAAGIVAEEVGLRVIGRPALSEYVIGGFGYLLNLKNRPTNRTTSTTTTAPNPIRQSLEAVYQDFISIINRYQNVGLGSEIAEADRSASWFLENEDRLKKPADSLMSISGVIPPYNKPSEEEDFIGRMNDMGRSYLSWFEGVKRGSQIIKEYYPLYKDKKDFSGRGPAAEFVPGFEAISEGKGPIGDFAEQLRSHLYPSQEEIANIGQYTDLPLGTAVQPRNRPIFEKLLEKLGSKREAVSDIMMQSKYPSAITQVNGMLRAIAGYEDGTAGIWSKGIDADTVKTFPQLVNVAGIAGYSHEGGIPDKFFYRNYELLPENHQSLTNLDLGRKIYYKIKEIFAYPSYGISSSKKAWGTKEADSKGVEVLQSIGMKLAGRPVLSGRWSMIGDLSHPFVIIPQDDKLYSGESWDPRRTMEEYMDFKRTVKRVDETTRDYFFSVMAPFLGGNLVTEVYHQNGRVERLGYADALTLRNNSN